MRITYKINRNSYNKIAKQWAEEEKKLNKLVIEFASKIKPYGKILDIGCGTGYPISKYLSDNGFFIIGIDISENMLQNANEKDIKNATFYLCDFFRHKPNETYDGIIAYDSLFHFPKEKQNKIYIKLSNWLNIGGYILFTHGKENNEINGKMFGETFYYSSLETREVHKLLMESGFEIILSIENYKEENIENDLIIIAKKIK